MGRAKGSGNVFDSVIRSSGIPMPIAPTESVGSMSGSRRTRKKERRSSFGGARQVTRKDPVTGLLYGGLELFNKETGEYEPQYKIPTREEFDARAAEKAKSQPPRQPMSKEEQARQEAMLAKEKASIEENRRMGGFYDPSKPSAVMETTRVNVQDPTLGGPPEREVPIPKERDTSPRGPAPFSPDERAMARDAFFEKMFSRADERKQSKAMDQEERRNVMDARRDEAAMRGGERGMKDEKGGMRRRRRGGVMRSGRRRVRRRDFTRRRSQMEGRRSREERAAFRDRFVSTLR